MKISKFMYDLMFIRVSQILSTIIIGLICTYGLQSKTTYEFKNLRVLDTNNVFQKLWFLDNDVYAFYDSTKLFMKVRVDGVLNNVIIDSFNIKNSITSIQMNDFDEFLIQTSNDDIYFIQNEFKKKAKITHLFNENFKFRRIICDHGTNFYAFNNSKIYIYNSNTSEPKLKTVPPNIEIIDMLADKSGKIWILTKDKIYWTDDFETWNEAKVNGIDKYIPSSFIEASSGNIYFLVDNVGVFCKFAEEEEFNIESFNLPMNIPYSSPFYFYNTFNGFIQVNSIRHPYIYNENDKIWYDAGNSNILRLYKGNKRNDFIKAASMRLPISQFWIYDSLIVHDNNNDNSWIKVNDIDSLGHYIYDIKSIKIDSESSVFYTLSKNNYYGKWDFETGQLISFKHINSKNNNTEKDLLHRSVFFTNDWKYYYYLTIHEKIRGYKIELYDNKNDSLISEFTIDNSNETALRDTTILSFESNPLAVYNPVTEDLYISLRSRYDIKAVQWGYAYRDYGGFYKINLSNNNVSINKLSNEYTNDFKISPNNNELFFATQYRYFGLSYGEYGVIKDKWDKRSSLLYYMNLESGEKKLLNDTSANAYSFIETDDTFSNVYTNFDSSLVKIDKSGKSTIISSPGKYSYNNTSFFDDGRYVFFRDIILYIDQSLSDIGSYYFYNIENNYLFRKIPVQTWGSHLSDFNSKSKSFIFSLIDGRIYRYICENNFKPKSDFGCIKSCIINQKIQFRADSSTYINKFFWDFGDGETIESRNYEKSYSSPGNYNVSLTVFNNYDSLIISKTNCISVHDSVIADFEADVTSGIAPLTVKFKSTSKSDIHDYVWSFGDGVESVEEMPVHTYVAPGIYNVQLEVYDVPDIHEYSFRSWRRKDNYIKVLDPLNVYDGNISNQKIKVLQSSSHNIILEFTKENILPNFIFVYDLMGNIIANTGDFSSNSNPGIWSIDFSNKLATGIYFIKVTIGDEVYNDKIIIIE